MKITLAPFGTSSDVLPMLALAKTLQSRGHAVTICAPEEFRSRIYKSEVPMVSSGQTYRKYLDCNDDLEDATSELVSKLDEDMATHFVAMRDAAREADVVVGSRLQLAAPSLAEQRRIAYLYAVTTPGHADHDSFPIFGVAHSKAHRKKSKRIKEWDKHVLTALNRERKIAHLPPVSKLFEYLYRSGPVLVAVDQRFRSGKNLPNQIATNYWYLNLDIDVDDETPSYFDAGPPAVYIAPFRFKDVRQILSLCALLVGSGHRVILGNGWNSIPEQDVPEGCRFIPSLSFAQLFPKMSAIVHAGSPDITMQAIRAKVPQVLLPYTIEETYWADRCRSLGITGPPVDAADAGKIHQAITETISNSAIRQSIEAFATPEDGTIAAAEAIEKTAEEHIANPKL